MVDQDDATLLLSSFALLFVPLLVTACSLYYSVTGLALLRYIEGAFFFSLDRVD